MIKWLADANLIVTDDRDQAAQKEHTATVDVAHEALIRNWPKLRQWLDDNRDLLRQQRKIELAAAEWRQQPREEQNDYLLQGRQLTNAQIFRQTHEETFPLSREADDYLNRSTHHRLKNRLKTIGLWVLVPLGLAGYVGEQTTTYFKLKPHWNVIYAYDSEENQIDRKPLIRALENINDHNLSLRKITLRGADLRGANLAAADLASADLRRTNMERSDLPKANLRNAYMDQVDLQLATLSEVNLSNAYLVDANLLGTNLDGANLKGTNLTRANLKNAYLRGANLTFANLSNADLAGAFLSDVDLRKADLSTANFYNSNLDNANLDDTNISDAIICKTILPKNIDLDPNRDCNKLEMI